MRSYLQFAAGRLEEGVAEARKALDGDPLSSYANTVFGYTCCLAGRHAVAIQACERAVELDSESFIARWSHHVALHVSGRFEEAVRAGELASAMSGRHPWAMASLAVAFADWGKPADAEALYAELAARGRRSFVSPVYARFGGCRNRAGGRNNSPCPRSLRDRRSHFDSCVFEVVAPL